MNSWDVDLAKRARKKEIPILYASPGIEDGDLCPSFATGSYLLNAMATMTFSGVSDFASLLVRFG